MKVYTIIPARSGSKGIKNKNIKLLCGHPLLAWSIAAAQLTPSSSRVIVSTDSMQYADIASQYGADVPFLRPPKISQDNSLDISFILHALRWLSKHENSVPDYVMHLRPTQPCRDPGVLERAIQMMIGDKKATSLCSMTNLDIFPEKILKKREDGYFMPLCGEAKISFPRQKCTSIYKPNGYVDIIATQHLLDGCNLYGNRRMGFFTENVPDIDLEKDFDLAQQLILSPQLALLLDYLNSFNGKVKF